LKIRPPIDEDLGLADKNTNGTVRNLGVLVNKKPFSSNVIHQRRGLLTFHYFAGRSTQVIEALFAHGDSAEELMWLPAQKA
jgi:hypothetical protein